MRNMRLYFDISRPAFNSKASDRLSFSAHLRTLAPTGLSDAVRLTVLFLECHFADFLISLSVYCEAELWPEYVLHARIFLN
jgi:hypothetical protein